MAGLRRRVMIEGVVVFTAVAAVVLAAIAAAAFAWWRLVAGIRTGRWRSATATEVSPLAPRWSRLTTDPWVAEPLAAAIAAAATLTAALLLVVTATTAVDGDDRGRPRVETTGTTMPVPTTEAAIPSSIRPSGPFDGACSGLCATIIEATVLDNGELSIEWEARNVEPSVTNFHVHFFYDIYEPEQVGTNASQFGTSQGDWHLTDQTPLDTTGTNVAVANAPAEASQICVVVADAGHGVANPENATCIDLP